jgi:hypothetical protein
MRHIGRAAAIELEDELSDFGGVVHASRQCSWRRVAWFGAAYGETDALGGWNGRYVVMTGLGGLLCMWFALNPSSFIFARHCVCSQRISL